MVYENPLIYFERRTLKAEEAQHLVARTMAQDAQQDIKKPLFPAAWKS